MVTQYSPIFIVFILALSLQEIAEDTYYAEFVEQIVNELEARDENTSDIVDCDSDIYTLSYQDKVNRIYKKNSNW